MRPIEPSVAPPAQTVPTPVDEGPAPSEEGAVSGADWGRDWDVPYLTQKERARNGGPSRISPTASRISTQHHRCNAKSVHCPSNVFAF